MTSLENSSLLNNLNKIYDKADNLSQIPEHSELNPLNYNSDKKSSKTSKIVTFSSKGITFSSNEHKQSMTVSYQSVKKNSPDIHKQIKSHVFKVKTIIKKAQKNIEQLSQEKDPENIIIKGSEYRNDEDLEDLEQNSQQISQENSNENNENGLKIRRAEKSTNSNMIFPDISHAIISESLSEEIKEEKQEESKPFKKKIKSKNAYEKKPPSPSFENKTTTLKSKRITKKLKFEFNALENYKKIMMRNKEREQRSKKCNCKTSKCMSQYCVCFKNGVLCGSKCGCLNCINNRNNIELVNAMTTDFQQNDSLSFKNRFGKFMIKDKNDNLQEITVNTKGCNCSKSKCNKKYCECFKQKILCSNYCKCLDCHNNKQEIQIPLEIQKKNNVVLNKEFNITRNDIKNLTKTLNSSNQKTQTTTINTKQIKNYNLLRDINPKLPLQKIQIDLRTTKYQKKKILNSKSIIKKKSAISKRAKAKVKAKAKAKKKAKTKIKNKKTEKITTNFENESYIDKLNQIKIVISNKKINSSIFNNNNEVKSKHEKTNNVHIDKNQKNNLGFADNKNDHKMNINFCEIQNLQDLQGAINTNKIQIVNMTKFNHPDKCFLSGSNTVYCSSVKVDLSIPVLKKSNTEHFQNSSNTIRKFLIAKRSRSLGFVKQKIS